MTRYPDPYFYQERSGSGWSDLDQNKLNPKHCTEQCTQNYTLKMPIDNI